MWFIGLIVGLVIGAAIEDFEGAFYGAVLGALAGYALRLALGRPAEARLRTLEEEVANAARALDGAIQRIAQLETWRSSSPSRSANPRRASRLLPRLTSQNSNWNPNRKLRAPDRRV